MEKEPKKTTSYLLGEISGSVQAVKQKITEQNGSIGEIKKSVNGLSEKVTNLPCAIHEERINHILTIAEEKAKEENSEERNKRVARRDLLVALVAALLTGGFMLLGLWLQKGG